MAILLARPATNWCISPFIPKSEEGAACAYCWVGVGLVHVVVHVFFFCTVRVCIEENRIVVSFVFLLSRCIFFGYTM